MIASDPPDDLDVDLDAIAKDFEELYAMDLPSTIVRARAKNATRQRRRSRKLPDDLLELRRGIEAAAERRRASNSTHGGHPFDGDEDEDEGKHQYEIYGFMLGGMGMVLEAWNRELGRKEALKLWIDEDGNDQLLREAQTLARLRPHRNIVTIYGTGTWRGRRYFKMEWIDGQDARQWLDAKQRDWRQVVELYVEAGRGLSSAHKDGVMHHDFKPSNILVGDDGRVCVADFGVAATMRSSERMQMASRLGGTTSFMAPERIFGRNGDARSDQFSFCIALWEALHGEMPFWGETRFDLGRAIEEQEFVASVPHMDVPDWLREVVRKGLHFDPEQRYADMSALVEALTNVPAEDIADLVDEGPSADRDHDVVDVVSVVDREPEAGPSRALVDALSRYPFALAALGVLSGLVLGLGALMTLQPSSSPRSEFRLRDTEAARVISAEHAQWRLSVHRFNQAKDAIDDGKLETTHERWDDGRERVRAQQLAPVYAAASLGLAKQVAESKHDLNAETAGMVAAGAASLFQEDQYWWFAKRARLMAASFFRTAGLEGAAAFEAGCAAAHADKQACG